MNKLNLNKILVIAYAIAGASLIGKALSILLGYAVLNESRQIALLLVFGLIFISNCKNELSKIEEERGDINE